MATGEKSPPVYRTEEFAQSALSLPLQFHFFFLKLRLKFLHPLDVLAIRPT